MQIVATLTINPKTYGELLAEERPTAIRNDAEHSAAVEHLTRYAIKGRQYSRGVGVSEFAGGAGGAL